MTTLRSITAPRRFAVASLLALAVAAAPFTAPEARAGGLADEAELHFQIGAESYQKGDFRGALEHFFTSNRLVPNRNVVFNIARTYEQMKRWADAHRYYTDALEEEDRAQQIQNIQAGLARVTPYVALLKVESDPPGATIYIDRKDLGSRGRAPRALALAEGKYRVIAVDLDLYDLDSDVGETRNLASERPEVVARLQGLADAMRASLGDRLRRRAGTEVRPAETAAD